jgi:valyl-tRNA synthetase
MHKFLVQRSFQLTLVAIFQILTEDDPSPPGCATNIVNKDLAVYLQLQGALNTEAEHEKLRKKRQEVQKYVQLRDLCPVKLANRQLC